MGHCILVFYYCYMIEEQCMQFKKITFYPNTAPT